MCECPRCKADSGVKDSRSQGSRVLRVRRCVNSACGFTWRTVELSADEAVPNLTFETRLEKARRAVRDFEAQLNRIGAEL